MRSSASTQTKSISGKRLEALTEGYTRRELATLRRLNTPTKIQQFLDREIQYNLEPDGATCYSPRLVLEKRVAHCMEGALLAAAALRFAGYPPLLLDLAAVRDSDHVLAIYKSNGGWGSIAKSNYAGLRSREPIYRTVRELAISYFEHYFNHAREKTLRMYSRPINLARFDKLGWMTAERELWEIPSYLVDVPHTPILTPEMLQALGRVDARMYESNCVGTAHHKGK
ncbi:MAG: hypothetical protein ABI824_00580 [Acidobacteriota bacterium]